jgi:hypothetical protein
MLDLRRRDFALLLGGAAVSWPLDARAQQPAMPVIGFINGGSANASARFVTARRAERPRTLSNGSPRPRAAQPSPSL